MDNKPKAEAQPNPFALTWGLGYTPQPGGQAVCTLQITQGAMMYALNLPPDDLERLGNDLISTARQARTGLIIGSPKLPTVK